MIWLKKGHIYKQPMFGTGYSQSPFVDIIDDKIWRLHIATRTKDNISYPTYVDLEAGNPKNIIKKYEKKPILQLGKPGTFDYTGVIFSSILDINGVKYVYYIGWNKELVVPYTVSIGLALSEDGGKTFHRAFDGPIMGKSKYDPIFVTSPCVIRIDDYYRMYYVSCTDWKSINNRLESVYIIKTAISKNGIDFETNDHICINSEYEGEALARPWVIKDGDIYKMWFSTRGSLNFRHKNGQHYTISYAESKDGLNWVRYPNKFNLTTSESGWDSEMIEYSSVLQHNDKYYMFYNGNSFSKTGVGYAVSEI